MKKINWKNHLIEVLVVIIGVSIAFALNNWKEQGDQEEQERIYLESLRSDIESDIEQLDSLMSNCKRISASHARLLYFLKNEPASPDSLFTHTIMLFALPDFQANVVTYDALKSSGDLRLINSFGLKKAIFETYQRYGTIEQLEQILLDNMHQVSAPYLLDHFDYDVFQFTGVADAAVKAEVMAFLMNDRKFKNLVYANNGFIYSITAHYNKAKQRCIALKATLDAEIAKK